MKRFPKRFGVPMAVPITGTSEKGATASVTPSGGESPVPPVGPVVTHLTAKENLWEELGHLQPPMTHWAETAMNTRAGREPALTDQGWSPPQTMARDSPGKGQTELCTADLGSL